MQHSIPLRTIIEMDGVLMNPKPCWWAAYGQAATAVGAARTDEATFWRLVRTGSEPAMMVRYTTPKQADQFKATLLEVLESDACVAGLEPHDDVAALVKRLSPSSERVLVTARKNRSARQAALSAVNLDDLFLEMRGLSTDAARRSSELAALADDRRRVVVVASTPEVVRSAARANLPVIGCSTGDCSGRRLTQAGADWVVSDLEELVKDVETGGRQLQSLGVPAPM